MRRSDALALAVLALAVVLFAAGVVVPLPAATGPPAVSVDNQTGGLDCQGFGDGPTPTTGPVFDVGQTGTTGDTAVCLRTADPGRRVADLELTWGDEATVLDREVTLTADRGAVLDFGTYEGRPYRLRVDPANGSTRVFRYGPEAFDCNWRRFTITVAGNGTVGQQGIATTMGCG